MRIFSALRTNGKKFSFLKTILACENCLKGAQEPKIYLLTSDVRSAYRRRNGRVAREPGGGGGGGCCHNWWG